MVRRRAHLPLLIALTLLFVTGCEDQQQAGPYMSVVNVETLMQRSKPAEAAREHLKKVQEVLQNGFNDVQKEWAEAKEDERKKVEAEALAALNRQFESEARACQQIVEKIMRDEVARWRKVNRGYCVLNRQLFLDVDEVMDVTDDILKKMNQISPVFPELPKIEVVRRERDGKEGKEAKKEPPVRVTDEARVPQPRKDPQKPKPNGRR